VRARTHAVTTRWPVAATRWSAAMQWPDQHLVFAYSMRDVRGRCPSMFQWWGLTDVGYQWREADFGLRSDVSSTAVCSGGWQWRWKAPVGLEGQGGGEG
jgi:hypothetical protein